MKKFCCFLLVMMSVILGISFFNLPKTEKTTNIVASAEETQLNIPEWVFSYISISQDGNGAHAGHTFTARDFTSVDFSNLSGAQTYSETIGLYTSKTITMKCLDLSSFYNSLSIRINGEDVIINNAYQQSDYIKVIDNAYYIVFDNSTASGQDKISRVRITLNSGISYSEFSFLLIQTQLNFVKDSILWEFALNDEQTDVSEPTAGCTYPPITLKIPNGTIYNPVHVSFVYCGEKFEVYNIGGTLYNAYDDSPLSYQTIVFDLSGTYTVDIFDNTDTAHYEGNNHKTYNFIIENTTTPMDRFYFHAFIEENGNIIMNEQHSNSRTIVELVNLNATSIRNQVTKIVVTRSYREASEKNDEQTSYIGSDIDNIIDNQDCSLAFDQDGIYKIDIYLNNDNEPARSFSFTLIASIMESYEIEDALDENGNTAPASFSVAPDEQSNVVNRYEISRQVETTYSSSKTPLKSFSRYSYNIRIARSAPSISGTVKNGGSTSSDVALVVRGVGKLQVSVSQDGKTTTREYKTDDSLPTFTQTGKYVIRLVDEMGNQVSFSFTINVKMNAAAITLIVIAAVALALTVIAIIVSRMRVKVR